MRFFNNVILPIVFCVAVAALSVIWLNRARGAQHKEEVAEVSELLPKSECEISIYDNVFRRVGKASGIDWRLMSAIAYHESRFHKGAVSSQGAVGLMQIMPHVAKKYGVSREELLNPIRNIEISAQIIKSVERSMQLPRGVPAEDRLALMLACYNGGYAHISDACNLAEFYGDNRYSWETISEYLYLLSDADFYNHEAVSFGAFRGSDETIKYVNAVLSRYNYYCSKTERD